MRGFLEERSRPLIAARQTEMPAMQGDGKDLVAI
jgi:hypothetical protein